MRISGRNLNRIQTALTQRTAILNGGLLDNRENVNTIPENLFGDDVKMVSKRSFNPVLLTTEEKDEVVNKYKSGMNMTAIANQYGCHRTTVRSILLLRGVVIRN